MASRHAFRLALCLEVASAVIVLTPTRLLAHCDSLDGPVVKAAQRALDTRNPAFVLIWVRPEDERDVRQAFDRTLAVRNQSPQARELADRFFFETVVRVHRAGEGEPFTGLKPAGLDLGPAIPAADHALATESVEPVVELLADAIGRRVREQFHKVVAVKRFDRDDVAAGRGYVTAYVEFIHLVERVYAATGSVDHDHSRGSDVTVPHGTRSGETRGPR